MCLILIFNLNLFFFALLKFEILVYIFKFCNIYLAILKILYTKVRFGKQDYNLHHPKSLIFV